MLAAADLAAQAGDAPPTYRGAYRLLDFNGTAEYAYRTRGRDTLREGPFRMQASNLDSLLAGKTGYFSAAGTYDDDRPAGDWQLAFGEYRISGSAEVVDYQYRLDVDGTLQEASGAVERGRPTGEWINLIRKIEDSAPTEQVFRSAFTFAEGTAEQSFRLEAENASLLGRFKRDGLAHDAWTVYADLAEAESWAFTDGWLEKVTVATEDGPRAVEVLGPPTGRTTRINLDARYLAFLRAWQEMNGRPAAFVDGPGGNLLGVNAGHYREIGEVMAALGAENFTPEFGVVVPHHPLAAAERRQLDSVQLALARIDTLSGALVNNFFSPVAEQTDPEVAALRAELRYATDTLLAPVRRLESAYAGGLLSHLPRDRYLAALWEDAAVPASVDPADGLAAVEQLTGYARTRVDSVRARISERLYTRERRNVLTALEDQLMYDVNLLDSLVNARRADVSEEYGLDNVRQTAARALQDYGELDDFVARQDRAEELIGCVRELDALAITAAELPAREREIKDLYTDEVWNNFTATVMEDRVKRRLINAYEDDIVPYLKERLSAPLACPDVRQLNTQINDLHQRMRELRTADTDDLEDEIRDTDDPRAMIQLITSALQQ